MASLTLQLPKMNLWNFFTQSVFGNNGTYIYCVLDWDWRRSATIGACVNFFRSLDLLHYLENELLSWSKSFCKPCSEKFGLSVWMPYWFIYMNIQHCKFQQPGYYDFSAATFSNYITHILGKTLAGISPTGTSLINNEYILNQYLTLISQRKIWCD